MRKRLHLKGWKKEEIDHAERILKKAEENKHPDIRFIDSSLFWLTLAVGTIGTFSVSIFLIPILIASNSSWTYFFSAFFGLLLSLMILTIIQHMHWLEDHHHLSVILFVPIIGVFNFFAVVQRVNELNNSLGLSTHNPVVIGIIYFLAFVLPYAAFLFFRRRR